MDSLYIQKIKKEVHINISPPESRNNNNLKTANKYFENVAKFKYLRKTVTHRNYINKRIKLEIKFREFLILIRPNFRMFYLPFAI